MRASVPAGLLAILLAVPATASSGVATVAAPTDLARAPLLRAALVALPAVYGVEVRIHVDALRAGRRRIAVDHDVGFHGGAFAVAPGRIVTAGHLVAPSNRQIVDAVLETVTLTVPPSGPGAVRAVTRGKPRITLTRARTDAAGAAGPADPVAAAVLDPGDPIADLALLRIAATPGPTLTLDDGLTKGTPVAGIAFGDATSSIPVLRLGTLDGQGAVKGAPGDRRLAPIDLPVEHGDSGGPVLDGRGDVRGVILRVASGDTPAAMASANAIRGLLAAHRVDAVESSETAAFRDAMGAFWRRRYALASARLSELRGRYPDAALVALEARRAAALAAAEYRLEAPARARGLVLAVGAMAAVCAAILLALRLRRWPVWG